MNGTDLSYVGNMVSGNSAADPAVAQVLSLLRQLEPGPPVAPPPAPAVPPVASRLFGGLGDALLSMASVRSGRGPVPLGPYRAGQERQQQEYERQQEEYRKESLATEAANRNLRNSVRLTTLNRRPQHVSYDTFIKDVNGVPHNMRQGVDPNTGHGIGEPEDLGPVGYAPKELTPGQAETEKDRLARAKETAIAKINKLRIQSEDYRSQMQGILNASRIQGTTKSGVWPFDKKATWGKSTLDQPIQDDPSGLAPVPKNLQPYRGMTYRQAYQALGRKNDAAVKEINRLWGVAGSNGEPPPPAARMRAAPGPPRSSSAVPGYSNPEVNAYRDMLEPDEQDQFDAASPEVKARALDKTYGRDTGN